MTLTCRACGQAVPAPAPPPKPASWEGLAFSVDDRCRLHCDLRVIQLTGQECAVLAALAETPGRPLSSVEIVRRVWGPDWSERNPGHLARQAIYRLRQRLRAAGLDPLRVVLSNGRGLVIGYWVVTREEQS